MTSIRLTRCPNCGVPGSDEIITIHNPGTHDLNAQAMLRCTECNHVWEGRTSAPLRQWDNDPWNRPELRREAYTVGYAKSYDEALARPTEENPNTKLGRRTDYGGGWVWRTPEEAATFLTTDGFARAFPGRDPKEFSVYRLELPAGWEIDVSSVPHPGDGVHRLLNDARIMGKAA